MRRHAPAPAHETNPQTYGGENDERSGVSWGDATGSRGPRTVPALRNHTPNDAILVGFGSPASARRASAPLSWEARTSSSGRHEWDRLVRIIAHVRLVILTST
jgi:hypothetical protein